MAIADDFSIAVAGDIRRTGTAAANHTVLEFHRFIGGLLDDAQASGDDLADITTDTISDRATDNIITLNAPFNIDDTAARHLYDGSITQAGGDTLYSGLNVLGPVETGTEVMVVQDDKILPSWWGTGVNPSGAIITSMLIKSRDGGADIDGKRIICMVRELGDTYKEFGVTLGLANSVAAVANGSDLNNTNSRATLEGYTTVALTEGFQLIDIDNDTVNEEYYASFARGSQTLNDTYEVSKWWQARSLATDSSTATGTDFIVDNATIVGQGHEFSARGQAEKLTEMRFNVKIGNGTPTGPLHAELYISDDATPGVPTGGVLATSEPVLASLITANYAEIIFRFNDFVDGTDQRTGLIMTASEDYFAVIRHPDGDATNRFAVEGSVVAGDDNGTRAEETGAWAGQTNDNLNLTVKSSPVLFGRAGEKHRGVTHEIVYDGESGSGLVEDDICFWGTRVTYDGEAGVFERGRYVEIQPSGGGTIKNGGKILFDDTTGNVLYLALENITGNLADNDIITQIGGTAASANATATIVDDNRGGGEGILLAKDDNGAAGDLYIQLISGVVPVDNLRISKNAADFVDVAVTVTARTISPEFIGVSTGSNIIGAYGIGFNPTTDVGPNDLFFDLTDNPFTPPNNVTFTITGLVSGDRVLVGPRTGSTLNKAQLQTDTNLSSVTETLIQCSSAIPTDTPASGTGADNTRVRVELDSGIYRRVQYDSYTANDFTITTGPDDDWSGANVSTQPKDVFVAYIDVAADATSEAFTAVYKGSDTDLLVRVREGSTPGAEIKTFEGNAVFGNVSSSVPAVRQDDF